MKGQYPALFDLTGNVTLYDQLKQHGIDPATVPPFEAAVINALQAFLTALIELRRSTSNHGSEGE